MIRSGTRSSVVPFALTLGMLGAQAAGDTLHLGRLIANTGTLNGPTAHFVEQDTKLLEEFCGDEDGCEVALKCAADTELRAERTDLFLSPSAGGFWTTTSGSETHQDDDGSLDIATSVLIPFGGDEVSARLSDQDGLGIGDTGPGFGLFVNVGVDVDAICSLVYED